MFTVPSERDPSDKSFSVTFREKGVRGAYVPSPRFTRSPTLPETEVLVSRTSFPAR